MFNWLVNNTEACQAITSIATVIISIVAIVVSVTTYCMQRKLQIENIKPLISFELIDLPDRIAIKLRNDGLGVGKIKEAIFAGKCGGRWNNLIDAIEGIGSTDAIKEREIWKRYLESYKDLAIAPNRERILIEIKLFNNIELLDDIRDILKQIETKIIYTDIYDNEQKPLKTDFEYFNRKLISPCK